jgi:hypothetical protein
VEGNRVGVIDGANVGKKVGSDVGVYSWVQVQSQVPSPNLLLYTSSCSNNDLFTSRLVPPAKTDPDKSVAECTCL